jgi:hypothetical protein
MAEIISTAFQPHKTEINRFNRIFAKEFATRSKFLARIPLGLTNEAWCKRPKGKGKGKG